MGLVTPIPNEQTSRPTFIRLERINLFGLPRDEVVLSSVVDGGDGRQEEPVWQDARSGG